MRECSVLALTEEEPGTDLEPSSTVADELSSYPRSSLRGRLPCDSTAC